MAIMGISQAATASTVSYTPNSLDQYSAIGAVTPAYDGNGNLTYDGTFTYGYDAESRLISASGGGTTASYAYDAQGRRKSKTVNGTTTIFVQDPQGRALLDYAGSGGAVTNWYAFGQGPNDVLNQVNVSGSTRATYVPDIQGSIVAALDASSSTLTKAGYQPYGESGTTSGTFRYTGARIDAETNGLYDFRARTYSPKLGRFMQTDPIGTAGGINLYAYVGNDPLNLTDSSGLTWADDARMFGQWVTGTAPAHQTFGPDTNQTQDMMNAPGVNAARDLFYQKNVSRPVDQLLPVTNFAARFGLSGYVQAGTNSTQQFVGSYGVEIMPNSNGTITFSVNNTTSMTSFFYGIWPDSWNPSAGHPMGNYSQTYTWTEPYAQVGLSTTPAKPSSSSDNSFSGPGDSRINLTPGGSSFDQSNFGFGSGNTGK
jgi:RHS repeat-associated protein